MHTPGGAHRTGCRAVHTPGGAHGSGWGVITPAGAPGRGGAWGGACARGERAVHVNGGLFQHRPHTGGLVFASVVAESDSVTGGPSVHGRPWSRLPFSTPGIFPTQTSLVSQERERDCGIAETLGRERPLSSSFRLPAILFHLGPHFFLLIKFCACLNSATWLELRT